MALLDWSDPHKTPRLPSSPDVAARQGGGVSPATPRPLSFASSGGDVVWQTYPAGSLVLTLDHAEQVALLITDEWTRARMAGGGPCEAITMLHELNTAIEAAKAWRQCQGRA